MCPLSMPLSKLQSCLSMMRFEQWAFLFDYRFHAMWFKMSTKSLKRERGISAILKWMCRLLTFFNPNNLMCIVNIGGCKLVRTTTTLLNEVRSMLKANMGYICITNTSLTRYLCSRKTWVKQSKKMQSLCKDSLCMMNRGKEWCLNWCRLLIYV